MTTLDTRTELVVEPVDPHDEDAVRVWTAVTRAVMEHEIGDHSTMWTFPETLVIAQNPAKSRRELFFLARLGGVVVASGWVTLPMLSNLTSADLLVMVLPEHRRRGLGSQVLAHLEGYCRDHGRSRFDAIVDWPYDGPADGAGVPGVEFAKAHGYSFGLGDVQREVPLPIDAAVLEELAAEAAPAHRDYELRAFAGPIPDELVRSFLELSSTLMTEAPAGDLERENGHVDIEAQRVHETVMAKAGRTVWTAVALAADGRVVAFTTMVVPAHDPKWVVQWGTLVHREHRGHRLGLAVKVANLQALQASGADLAGRRLVTWNAEVNDHMIGINERMGFRPTGRAAELQKKLP